MTEAEFDQLIEQQRQEAKQIRSKYHVTLGQLIDFLKSHKDRDVVFVDSDNGEQRHLSNAHSYRGFPTDLAFQSCERVSPEHGTAKALLKKCKDVLNQSLTGWKGGSFLMSKDTPLWISKEGCIDGVAIIQLGEICYADKKDVVILITKKIE